MKLPVSIIIITMLLLWLSGTDRKDDDKELLDRISKLERNVSALSQDRLVQWNEMEKQREDGFILPPPKL